MDGCLQDYTITNCVAKKPINSHQLAEVGKV